MPFEALPSFMAGLQAKRGTGAEALWFLIHTAARSGEVRGATWDEISLSDKLWRIPGERMKAKKPHTVPLSEPVLSRLRELSSARRGVPGELLFPGQAGRPLSDMTLTKVLRSCFNGEATVHGFRSSFRDWVAERNPLVSDAIAEAALAHTNPNKVESAYRRTDFLQQRAPLMANWTDYLQAKPAKLSG
ncbi:tyrosine-type recombinase/integrase [Sphingomonas sinipercae]|nr:site-specific integrase [Sphingomonas sinipercae]